MKIPIFIGYSLLFLLKERISEPEVQKSKDKFRTIKSMEVEMKTDLNLTDYYSGERVSHCIFLNLYFIFQLKVMSNIIYTVKL